jgi:hypothetical protein
MAAQRQEKSTEYIRHNFTSDERLAMGNELANAYNRLADIETDEAVVKSQFKERKAQVEQTVSKLSRELGNGFTMQNVECRLEWDKPNVNEVSYVRIDTGEVVKTRPFTAQEMQDALPLTASDGTIEIVAVAPEQSAENITEFFGEGAEQDPDDAGTVEVEPAEEEDELVAQERRRKAKAEAEAPEAPTHAQVGKAAKKLREM